ncbi:beta-ribofuranosylaminobenzene 5'-phosphate synthase family protein [Halonotius roseus]|uniref:Beta-ribofuranosylaminobenzene 5'-phosphate synthase n=1 Tax=Halonotius roseus TaxID=2511997 RepID=A0A544QNV9_9EURY|nr:beta-ribofuranosylaminobenzene 5'-phosphate synthase family protein [Halonotius roseus]TQQ80560.1 GHMP kinase [Halonotius roseus]
MTQVAVGGRLHFGFSNLSLSHSRLYGALGVALEGPQVSLSATPADAVDAPPAIESVAETVCEQLGVDGVSLRVDQQLPAHVGLGSGTQQALAVATAVAGAYDKGIAVREIAPALGRGGRSGIGVATFEAGGFVLDGGHPTARFTTDRPQDGDWTVPPVAARHPVPDDWRFLLVVPDSEPGRSGDVEDDSIRAAIERAEPAIADRISGLLTRRVLPAIAAGDADRFGKAVAEIGRLNGAWYADEQGGVYRPPVGELVDALSGSPAIYGAGQSSWGPTVYGITDAGHAEAARDAGRTALEVAGIDGDVQVVAGRNHGARVAGDPIDVTAKRS